MQINQIEKQAGILDRFFKKRPAKKGDSAVKESLPPKTADEIEEIKSSCADTLDYIKDNIEDIKNKAGKTIYDIFFEHVKDKKIYYETFKNNFGVDVYEGSVFETLVAYDLVHGLGASRAICEEFRKRNVVEVPPEAPPEAPPEMPELPTVTRTNITPEQFAEDFSNFPADYSQVSNFLVAFRRIVEDGNIDALDEKIKEIIKEAVMEVCEKWSLNYIPQAKLKSIKNMMKGHIAVGISKFLKALYDGLNINELLKVKGKTSEEIAASDDFLLNVRDLYGYVHSKEPEAKQAVQSIVKELDSSLVTVGSSIETFIEQQKKEMQGVAEKYKQKHEEWLSKQQVQQAERQKAFEQQEAQRQEAWQRENVGQMTTVLKVENFQQAIKNRREDFLNTLNKMETLYQRGLEIMESSDTDPNVAFHDLNVILQTRFKTVLDFSYYRNKK